MLWLEWWNFMFLLPLIGGLTVALALVATGAFADIAADVDSGDLADGGELDSDGESDEMGENAISQILSFFGLGQGLPLSVMLPLLLMTGGLSGLIFNSVFASFIKPPMIFASLSLVASFGLSAFVGQGLAKLMRKLLKEKPSSIRSSDLIGLEGRAVYAITEASGVAHVKDPYGNIHRISCRALAGHREILAGEPLTIKDYDSSSGAYLVELIKLEKGRL